MSAKQQPDLVLIFCQQSRLQRALCTGCPLRHPRQSLHHSLYDFRVTSGEGHSQKVPAVRATRFRVKIG